MSTDLKEVTLKEFILHLNATLEKFPDAIVPFASEFRIEASQCLLTKVHTLPRLVYNYHKQQYNETQMSRNLSLLNDRNF